MRAVNASEIALGEAIAFPIHNAAGQLLLERGSVVTSQRQFDRLLECGFVLSDPKPCAPGPAASPGPAPVRAAEPIRVFAAVRLLSAQLQLLHNQLLSRATGDFADNLMRIASQLDALVAKDADAALASVHLHVPEEGLGARLMHSAVLCRVLAAATDMDGATRLSTLAAALTYDVALTPISAALNHQSAPLSPQQRAAIDRHPAESWALLREAGIDDPVWLDAVLHHHERVDGSGYPNRLQAHAISLPGRMLGIVDSFSAMVRPRAYRDAVLSRQALRNIFVQRSQSMDEQLATLFVREIGIYPPGSLVRLANGEVAMVVRRGAQLGQPDVRVLIHADDTRAIAYPPRDTGQRETAVVEGLAPQKYRSVLSSIDRLWRTI